MKIVIFGANEVGCSIATQFFEDHDITVIDSEENRVEEFNKLDIRFIYGNGSNINVLRSAEIKDADIFIACSTMDEANIVACLTVKKMSDAKTVCFVSKQEYIESLMLVKDTEYQSSLMIDTIIWPEEILTQEIFRIITVPEAIDVENFEGGKARMTEYRIKENSKILNKKIKDCTFPEETLIVGITKDSNLSIPDGETVLALHDKVIFMGSAKSLDILASEFFQENDKIKSVVIIGGGNVGLILAENLEKTKVKVKIIEKDYRRCEILNENLKKTLVLKGDGTNLALLEQEEIGESDVVVSVTNNDEKNLLCSLLAKQLGTPKVLTRVSKLANIELFEKVGIEIAISAKDSAVNEIRKTLIERDKNIIATVERGQGEILEVKINPNFKDTAVMDLDIPQKAIIAVIKRANKVIIPKGMTLIRANDNLIIFTTKQNSPHVKKYFKK